MRSKELWERTDTVLVIVIRGSGKLAFCIHATLRGMYADDLFCLCFYSKTRMTVFASGRPARLMPRYLSASATTEVRRSVNKRRRAAGSAPTSRRFLPQRVLIRNPRNTDAEDVAEGMLIRWLSAAEARSLPPHVLHPLAPTKPNLRTRKRRKQYLERENPVPRAQTHNGAHVPLHVLRPLAPIEPI